MFLESKVPVMAIYFGLLIMLAFNEMMPITALFDPETEDGMVKFDDYPPPETHDSCREEFVEIAQSPTGKLPSGTPVFSVQISVHCPNKDISVEAIHLHCGNFTSEIPVPSSVFERVGDDDCLVNRGRAIFFGDSVSFDYANSYAFPLQLSSFTCEG